MSVAPRHLRNLAFNWGGHISTLLVMFFLSPYIVGKLDAAAYGIWSLLNVLTGYMGIFDLGVRSSVGRYIALYLGKKDEKGVDETIRAGFGFFSLCGGGILIVGVLLGWLFPSFFKGVTPEQYGIVRALLPIMVINIWLAAIGAIYSSVLAGHDRFDIARTIDLFVLGFRTIATVWVLHEGWGLWGLAGTVVFGNFVSVIVNRIYAGKCHDGLRSFPFLYTRTRFGELFGYGSWAFITSAAYKLIGQSDLVIVGMVLSVSEVREYSVGAMLIYYSSTFIKIISRTFFPAVQRLVAAEKKNEVIGLFFKQTQISLVFGILLYVGYSFFAPSFIKLWMLQESFNQAAVNDSAAVMSLLAIASLPLLLITPCQDMLAAKGQIRLTAILSIVEALVNIALSLSFVVFFEWGLLGVAAGTLVSRLLLPGIYLPYLFCRELEIRVGVFISKLIKPAVVSASLISAFCFFSLKIHYPQAWISFAVHIVIIGVAWAFIALFVLVPIETRKRLLNGFSK
jgi:O-antigen/teichoic acid export membrane protein